VLNFFRRLFGRSGTTVARREWYLWEVSMPNDWNDHEGWERYYRYRRSYPEYLPTFKHPQLTLLWVVTFLVDDFLQLVQDLRSQGQPAVWVPGCGMSPLAKFLAHLGLRVVATDVSPAATAFQLSDQNDISKFLPRLGPAVEGGTLTAEVHDFRTDFRLEAFDLILNVKAFQRFPPADMVQIARVHARALKPGRCAYFDTLNSISLKKQIEQALLTGGFVLPDRELQRWYHQALQAAAIPHRMHSDWVSVVPIDQWPADFPHREQTVARLAQISEEYEARAKTMHRAPGANAKQAFVMYGSG
jgi:SAM-dependent methyltransferase